MLTKVQVRLEQFRQASRIHGGMAKMWAVAMGVKLSRMPIPRRLRTRFYRMLYGGKFASLPEEQLERPLSEYRSLNELFTHGMRPEFRPLAAEANQFVCPCDCQVQDIGRLNHDSLLTVKGIEYSLTSLLPGVDTQHFEGGTFGIFFLSPVDCHRVYSPQEGVLQEIIHVPGRRLLVHPPYQRKEFPVFTLNERVIIRLQTPFGNCLLVMVAGWGVGHVTYPFLKLRRPSKHLITRQKFDTPIPIQRGQWVATFELGSTVIMITEPRPDIITHIARDDRVNYGQAVYSFPMVGASPSDQPANDP